MAETIVVPPLEEPETPTKHLGTVVDGSLHGEGLRRRKSLAQVTSARQVRLSILAANLEESSRRHSSLLNAPSALTRQEQLYTDPSVLSKALWSIRMAVLVDGLSGFVRRSSPEQDDNLFFFSL